MSARGARIDHADLCPACGTPLLLNLYLAPDSDPVPVVGEVVSLDQPGALAVEFRPLDPASLRFMSIVLTTLGQPVSGRLEDRKN
jgi:hypothetical protein